MCQQMQDLVLKLQDHICTTLESVETVRFREDIWDRPGGGGGRTRVIADGSVFEKGGVNTSAVTGTIEKEMEIEMFGKMLSQQNISLTSPLKGARFFATGISLVIHPFSPMIPTTHANYRYFELITETESVWWFGGGADLTPYYLVEADALHFHQVHKTACDGTDPQFYPQFKAWCDTYFCNTHREESRGIGGIFYDYLRDRDKEALFEFAKRCGYAFSEAYLPIVKSHLQDSFTEAQKHWQLLRRGRYVEFNLIYDRGTLFGLKTGGRIESILMSLPKHVSWEYDSHPIPGSPEAVLVQRLQHPIDYL